MQTDFIFVAVLVCGGIAAAIGHSKNRNVLGSFGLGALLGVIGIVLAALLPSQPPKSPLRNCVKKPVGLDSSTQL